MQLGSHIEQPEFRINNNNQNGSAITSSYEEWIFFRKHSGEAATSQTQHFSDCVGISYHLFIGFCWLLHACNLFGVTSSQEGTIVTDENPKFCFGRFLSCVQPHKRNSGAGSAKRYPAIFGHKSRKVRPISYGAWKHSSLTPSGLLGGICPISGSYCCF